MALKSILPFFNSTTGLFSYGSTVAAGVNACINGDCSLPGETNVVSSGCFSSVSVFTVDYHAPNPGSEDVRRLVEPLVGIVMRRGRKSTTSSSSKRLRVRSDRSARLVGISA